jgi:hypothetical protein
MTAKHNENAPKMPSVYYYAPLLSLSSTQTFLHLALLFATHLINDHFNFARVSITLIIY